MVNARHLQRGLALAVCLAATMALGACADLELNKELSAQVKTRGLIVVFEGLQPFSADRATSLAQRAAREAGLAAVGTTGNSAAYVPLAAAAHASGHSVYIIGYSLGGGDACNLAEQCQAKSIPIAILFLVDPGALGLYTDKIPANVSKVIFYRSLGWAVDLPTRPRGELLEDPNRTTVKFEDFPGVGHLDLPGYLAGKLASEIRNDAGAKGPGGGAYR